ncbi:MAG: hypothetical protein K2L52_04050, partial [Clostridia bacterium]|nr:hypothetical protein [Clostridia bacterium]
LSSSASDCYTITTIDEWEVFVKKMATDSTHGTGQYYVLGNDLDFAGKAFHPIVNFSGTFYGLGYSLKNINCATWQYWTGSTYVNIGTSNIAHSGFGTFCKITNATITDLIVKDYSFQNIPQSSTLTPVTEWGPFTGAIAGVSYGNDNVLNCHTTGEVKSTITYATYFNASGIVGTKNIANSTLLIYRCSSEIDANINVNTTNRAVMISGMLGSGGLANAIIHIYDCATNVRWTGTGAYHHVSVGVAWNVSLPTMENIVGTVDATTTIRPYSGVLTGTSSNVTEKNAYVEGKNGTASKDSIIASSRTSGTTTGSNINIVKSTTSYAPLQSSSYDALGNNVTTYSSTDIMIASAKTFFSNNYSNIWDTDKIGGSYDPDNSPVRNYLVATITFKNLLSGDKEEDITSVPTDDYMQGDVLPSASNNANFASYIAS